MYNYEAAKKEERPNMELCILGLSIFKEDIFDQSKEDKHPVRLPTFEHRRAEEPGMAARWRYLNFEESGKRRKFSG
jgi:hypothetical protein